MLHARPAGPGALSFIVQLGLHPARHRAVADDSYIVEYGPLLRHRRELADQNRARLRRLLIAVPMSLVLIALAASYSPPLAMLLGVVSALFLFFIALPGASSVDPGALAGVEGEVAVLKQLRKLPDTFLLLNRVRLPDALLPNGERELDFVVVGPTGLWIIEVKNTPGVIHVQPDQAHWPLVRRAGCGSSPSWNAVQNPLPQVQAQVDALARWFLVHGLFVQPRAAVVFAHAETALESPERSAIPVNLRDGIVATLLSADPVPIPESVRAALPRLRGRQMRSECQASLT